jgi:hypothetical protein
MGSEEERPFVQNLAAVMGGSGGAMGASGGGGQGAGPMIGSGLGSGLGVGGSMQTSSTTSNVNLYPCTTLMPGITVNFLDFEGENGSEVPVMAAGSPLHAASAFGGNSGSASSPGGLGTPVGKVRPPPRLLPGGPSRQLSFSPTGGPSGEQGPSSPAAAASSASPSSALLSGMGGGSGLARSLRDLTAQVLEGTIGAMGGHSAAAATTGPSSASSALARSEAVREQFPKLAYCCSDVVVLLGTEPFFSTRYMERALAFAKRANAGIQDVELPILLLVSNKRNCDECETDIMRCTQLFSAHMGNDLSLLDSYFSCIVCCQMPNRKTSAILDDGAIISGEDVYRMQISKLKTLLYSLLNARATQRDEAYGHAGTGASGAASSSAAVSASSSESNSGGRRLLSSRHGLWYAMLPKIVDTLNSGQPVHVSRLIDQAWAESVAVALGNGGSASSGRAASRQAALDVFKTFITYMRPAPQLSLRAPLLCEDILQRFESFELLACDVAVRITAARLRTLDRAFTGMRDRLEAAAAPHINAVLDMLAELAPCRAVYGESHRGGHHELGMPIERPHEPVLCLQEARTHAKAHRGSRRVRGGGSSLWQRLLALTPYNPTWTGTFDPGNTPRPDARTLVAEVLDLVCLSDDAFTESLLALQRYHSSTAVQVDFAPFVALKDQPGAQSTSAIYASDGPIRIRRQPLRSKIMPYCIGCSIFVPEAVNSGTTSTDSGNGTPSADAHMMTTLDDTSAQMTYAVWLKDAVNEVLATVGVTSRGGHRDIQTRSVVFDNDGSKSAQRKDGAANNSESGESADSLTARRRGGLKRAQSGSPTQSPRDASNAAADGSVQWVTLGLCRDCAHRALALNPILAQRRLDTSAAADSEEDADESVVEISNLSMSMQTVAITSSTVSGSAMASNSVLNGLLNSSVVYVASPDGSLGSRVPDFANAMAKAP